MGRMERIESSFIPQHLVARETEWGVTQVTVLRICLERGLLRLKAHARTSRAARFYSGLLCRRVFRLWRVYCLELYSLLTVAEPHNSGPLVFACFKWISVTLGRLDPVYPLVITHDGARNRVRSYVNGRLKLSALRLSLFFQSLAILDLHCLRLTLSVWRCAAIASARYIFKGILHGLLRLWRKWRLFASSSGAAFKRICELVSNSARYTNRRTWLAWSIAFRIIRHQLSSTRRLMKAALGAWRSQMNCCVQLNRTKNSAHAHYILWVLRVGFSQLHRFRFRWPLQTSGLIPAPPSPDLPSSQARIRKSLKRLQNLAESRVAQRMLCGCGMKHHLRRMKFNALQIGSGLIGGTRKSRVPPTTHLPSTIVIARYLKTWRAVTKTSARLNKAELALKYAVWGKLQATTLGSWILLHSRNKRIVVSLRKLRGVISRRTLWLVWFLWRHAFEHSTSTRLVGDNNPLLGVNIIDRKIIAQMRSIGKRAWQMRRGQLIVSRMTRVCSHILLQRSWVRWKVVNAAQAMATWIQSLFRGHRARKSLFPSARSHVEWFASQARQWVSFVRRRLLRAGLAVFLAHHRLVEIFVVQIAFSKSAIRCLRQLKCIAIRMTRNTSSEARGSKMHRANSGKALIQQLRLMLLSNAAIHAGSEWNKSMKAKGAIRLLTLNASRAHCCVEARRAAAAFYHRQKQGAILRLQLWHRWRRYHRKMTRRSRKKLMSNRIQKWLIFASRSVVTAKASHSCSIFFLVQVIRRMRIRTEIKTALRRLSWHHFRRHRFRDIMLRWVSSFHLSLNLSSDFILALHAHEIFLSRRYLGYLHAFADSKKKLRKLVLGGVEAMRIFLLRHAFLGMQRKNSHHKIDAASGFASLALLQTLTNATTCSGLRLTHVLAPQCPASSESHQKHIWSEQGPGGRRGRWAGVDGWMCPQPLLVVSRLTSLYVHVFRRLQIYSQRVQELKKSIANARTLFASLCLRRIRKWSHYRRLEQTFFATRGMRRQLCASLAVWLAKVPQRRVLERNWKIAMRNGECIRLRRALLKWAGLHGMCRQLRGCARRFRLHPALFAWLHLTAESMLSRKVVKRYCRRLCWKVFLAWRIVAERDGRIQMAHKALCRSVEKRKKFKVLLAWMKSIDGKRALERFQLAQLLAGRIKMLQSMAMWRDAIQGKKIAVLSAVAAALSTWGCFRSKVVALRRTALVGQHYHSKQSFQSMRRRLHMIGSLRHKGVDCEGLLLLNKCRCLCRKWVRMATMHVREARRVMIRIDPTSFSSRQLSTSAFAPPPPRPTLHGEAPLPPLFVVETHGAGMFLSTSPQAIIGALDARLQHRQLRSVLKFWCKWLQLSYQKRLQACLVGWKSQARRIRRVRIAFTTRVSVLLTGALARFCFDVLRAFLHLRQVEKTCRAYLLLVQKSKLLHFWLLLTRRRWMERVVLLKALSNLSCTWRADYFRHWRIAAGPRIKVERALLARHVLGCWSRHIKSRRHSRRLVLEKVVSGWCYHVFDKVQMRTGVQRARRLLSALLSLVGRQRSKFLGAAFAVLSDIPGKKAKDAHECERWQQGFKLIRSARGGPGE